MSEEACRVTDLSGLVGIRGGREIGTWAKATYNGFLLIVHDKAIDKVDIVSGEKGWPLECRPGRIDPGYPSRDRSLSSGHKSLRGRWKSNGVGYTRVENTR